jgi:hypothetical protein
MLRKFRPFFAAFLIAFHATLTLCAPCLHELPGASHHAIGDASKLHRSDDPIRPKSDSADGCVICQFIAQGHLPVDFALQPTPQLVVELALPCTPLLNRNPAPLASCPRAPPAKLIAVS